MGTARYLAPEQVNGRPTDPRTDVYALGLLIYEMLCGHPPFGGDTEIATAMARLTTSAPAMRAERPEVPQALDDVVHRCLARAAVGALRFRGRGARRPRPRPPRPHRRHPAPVVGPGSAGATGARVGRPGRRRRADRPDPPAAGPGAGGARPARRQQAPAHVVVGAAGRAPRDRRRRRRLPARERQLRARATGRATAPRPSRRPPTPRSPRRRLRSALGDGKPEDPDDVTSVAIDGDTGHRLDHRAVQQLPRRREERASGSRCRSTASTTCRR